MRTKAFFVIAMAAGALITSGLPKVIESIWKRRPAIIKAKAEKRTGIIAAKSEAAALIARTQVRAELLRAGLDPGKSEQAAEMLRLQSLDADLPAGRRLNDDALAKHLAAPKARSSSGGGPHDSEPGDGGQQGIVRPIR